MMGKVMNFTFGQNNNRVHPNKSPLKILEKRERGVSRDCPNFLGTPIISGTGKATNFNFCTHIYRLSRNITKAIKNFGKHNWTQPDRWMDTVPALPFRAYVHNFMYSVPIVKLLSVPLVRFYYRPMLRRAQL